MTTGLLVAAILSGFLLVLAVSVTVYQRGKMAGVRLVLRRLELQPESRLQLNAADLSDEYLRIRNCYSQQQARSAGQVAQQKT